MFNHASPKSFEVKLFQVELCHDESHSHIFEIVITRVDFFFFFLICITQNQYKATQKEIIQKLSD